MLRPRAILQWASDMFGPVALHRDERAARFVEEALELGQVEGLSKETVGRLLDRVYSKPAGDLAKEIGQAAMTLEALAENAGLSADAEVEREFGRVRGISQEEWIRRHDAKVALSIANLSPTT